MIGVCCWWVAAVATSQEALPPPNDGGVAEPKTGDVTIAEVRIEGHSGVTQIGKLPKLSTRAGTPFDAKLIEDDVRALDRTRRFIDIRTRYQYAPNGLVVIFQVVEKPILRYVKFIGMSKVKESKLKKETGLNPGDAMDPHRVEEARRTMESYYHEHGYPDAYVVAAEGTKIGDKGAVFVINEGLKQQVWNTVFEGNEIASDSRLRTQIESNHGFLYIFGGEVDHAKIDSDVEKITAYYRGLGFFQAKVGRILEPDEKGWLTIRFVINEGPRYKLRKISTLGNKKFSEVEMLEETLLAGGEYFDQGKLNRDLMKMRDMYGSQGHIYCDVQADTRFAEEPGQLDIVYKVEEGSVYRVGQVFVEINGESPHTRQRTVMNRMSLRPGDIVDTRKIRSDEIRLRRSQLFVTDPTKGTPPKIVISAPNGASDELKALAQSGGGNGNRSKSRFQSPDDIPVMDVTIRGTIDEQGPWTEAQRPEFWGEVDRRADVIERAYGDDRVMTPALPSQKTEPAAPPQLLRSPPRESVIFRPQQPSAGSVDAPQAPLPQDAAVRWRANYPGEESAAQPTPTPPALNRTQQAPAAERPRLVRDAQPVIRMQSPDPFAQAPGSSYGSPAYPEPGRYADGPANPLNRAPANVAPSNVAPAMFTQTAPNGYASTAQYNAAPVNPGRFVEMPNAAAVIQPVQYAEPLPGQPIAPFPGPPQQTPSTTLGIAPEPLAPGYGVGTNPVDPFPPGVPIIEVPPGDLPYMSPNESVDLTGVVTETQTGRLMFGVGVNSNAGVIGNIVLDEQNFDIRRPPSSWADIWSGQAWRGAGQRFRIEAAPGSQVSRYTVSFTEPYLMDTPVSFSASGFYFDRYYRDWFEQRVGGRFGLGYQFPQRPDLAVNANFRIENIEISQPSVPGLQELADVVGHNDLYGFGLGLTHDTRDSPFLPTEGWYAKYEAEYVTGSFNYPRATAELRKYFTLAQRADGSGRHVLAVGADLGITGDNTPIYDNFYAGGFSTLRGFRFRGASPRKSNVIVGGEVQLLGSVEYMLPFTADDALRGVVFCDFGTIEETKSLHADNLRVSPGFGLRISVPALGPAPIALDFAFPIEEATGDEKQVFTFFIGLGR